MTKRIGPDDVIGFWLKAGSEKWFGKDPGFDAEITRKFLSHHEAAQAGRYDSWRETSKGALALIILLDQFARNIHRTSPLAYACDAKALELAREAVDRGFDEAVDLDLRQFFCMPFMHSEDLADQALCLEICGRLGLDDTHEWAVMHADIIRRFGRYPHRNEILGRKSTPAEIAFLEHGGFSG